MTTTLRPFDTNKHRPLSRKIEREWKSGESTVKPGEFRPTETVVCFSVHHCKNLKAFVARLTPYEHHDNFVQWSSDNPGFAILVERVGRYSEKGLAEFSKTAYQHLVENADHPDVAGVLSQVPGITVTA
jgi:hypothetical protein